jgi:hypothetical protein
VTVYTQSRIEQYVTYRFSQGFGSDLCPLSFELLDPDLKVKKFHALDVLFGGLKASLAWASFMEAYVISKLPFLILKNLFFHM